MEDFAWAYGSLIVAVVYIAAWRTVFWAIDRKRR